MFRCLSVRIRTIPLALLLATTSVVSLDALADSGDYRMRSETRSNGVGVLQQVDANTFPQFQGSRPASSSPDTPGVEASHLRAVRMLVPNKSDYNVAIGSQDESAQIIVEFYNHALFVVYGGPSLSKSSSPFLRTDRTTVWQDTTHRWAQRVDVSSSRASHFVMTLYVVPRLDGASSSNGKGNLLLTVNEASVQGMHVITGRTLASDIALAVDESNWSRWRQAPLRAGLIRGDQDGVLHPLRTSTRRLPFIEQRTLDLRADSGGRRRDKRCLNNVIFDMSNLMLPLLLDVYFGRADLCSFDPHPNEDIAAPLPLVEVTDPQDIPRLPEPTVFEASALEPRELGHTDAFDAAMDVQFCNANHLAGEGEQPCTDEDRRAVAAIGELTPLEVDELLASIARMFAPDQQGAGTLRTGNAELDRWLNADLNRAEQALNAAKAIVRVSDAAANVNETIKKKKNKKEKVVKASCVIKQKDDGSDEVKNGADDEFTLCVKKAKRQLGETGPTVALPPHVDDSDRFHLRGTPGFTRLVREFRNTGRSLPPGMAGDHFAQFTTAIARDRAPTGDNLGLIYINDPTLRGNVRFKYGIEHIWAPGAGGGDDAGHRDDWQTRLPGLSVSGRDVLTQVIMAALTDPFAQFRQTRSRNGNVVRTFEYFTFRQGQRLFAIRNVRIVLGQNGMVITAFPLKNASAQSLEM